ncbi:probable sulfate transporter 4.2, partial [Salvia miltiorrhiza]|uniref:probable sulfate transporter 4.2 n=1 Tax=Salvia miltiorrhiza TaxID=226208 RepID=UPI0025AB9BA7
ILIFFISRLGWLLRFISHSVISGFTTASAIIIALSQAKDFLGYSVVRSSEIIPLVKSIIAGADQFLWQPFLMGSITLAVLLIMKHLGKTRKSLRFLRASGPLTAVVLGTIFVHVFSPSSISLVGEIPQGLPEFSIPKKFEYAESLIPTTILITGVAILESVGIAKALAAKNGYDLDSNQELFGLGVANIVGSFFSIYPTTGSFSRSAVNHESGAKTGLSGVIMGIIMGCALQFLTPLFEYIPQCGLAAIVISAVIGLVGVSLAFVIHESANPHIGIHFVILEMAPVTYIDSSAVQALKDLYHEYRSRNIQIAVSNPNRDVLLTLTRAEVVDLIGREWFFVRVHDAVQVCLQHVQSLTDSSMSQSPLLEKKSSLFNRILKQRSEEAALSQLAGAGLSERRPRANF